MKKNQIKAPCQRHSHQVYQLVVMLTVVIFKSSCDKERGSDKLAGQKG
jgi:hypothetical protein